MKTITFENKEATKTSSKPRKNCVTADDINDIKSAINENANINKISTSELKIGKVGNKDLYRNRFEIDYSNLTIDSTTYQCQVDVSSTGATELWVDLSHSYFEGEATSGNTTYKMKFPLNNAMINKTSSTGLGVSYDDYTIINAITQQFIQLFIGANRQTFFTNATNCKLILTVEYLKS